MRERMVRSESTSRKLSGAAAGLAADAWDFDSRVALIQAVLPLGVQAVYELLAEEVDRLAGPRYGRDGGQPACARWGKQRGSVFLADQKVAIQVPRVRNLQTRQEVPLASYQALRQPRGAEERALKKILKGLSCRDYQSCVDAVPETFGLAPSTLSRRFRNASTRQLAALNERDLSSYDLTAIFLDGKAFGEDEMVIAMGITMTGQKIILGFVQTATENEMACTQFLLGLQERGLRVEAGVLCVVDGSRGLRKAITAVFGDRAVVQRCQWHKRENVVSHLPVRQQKLFRRALSAAYEQPTYAQAKSALGRVRAKLLQENQSAVRSLDEGLEETLTLHRLGLFRELGRSFKTTNVIESLQAALGRRMDKVDCWRNSEQKQRWLAATLRDVEPHLNRVHGYQHLRQLRATLQQPAAGTMENVA